MGMWSWGGAKGGDRSGELQAAIAAIHRSQAVIEFDLSGAILTANANFLATMGYALDEIEGQHHSLFVEPDYRDSQAYADFWARLNAGEFLSDKFQRVAKGGRPVWIQASYNPVLDARGKPYKVIKFATDITAIERERAERDAERRETAAGQDYVVGVLATALRRVASGDLTARVDAAFDGRYQTIKDDFNVAVDSLRVAMGAISQSSDQLRNGAAEIAAASQDLSHRTEQQASSLEHTASALNEITTTVEHNADNARQASQSASNARAAALHSGEVMGEAILAMGEIEKSSSQITDVIGLIDEIAFQTNLLALNAGVEAARAGEAGRGFAVVAQEVRALSQRSAEAAKEIKSLIANSTRQVEHGVKLVADTDQALSGIVAKVAEIDGLMSSIAQSSKEQADRLNTVNGGVDHMNQVTQQNAVMVEQASAAARSLSREATELVRQVSGFRTGDQASVAPPAPQRLSA